MRNNLLPLTLICMFALACGGFGGGSGIELKVDGQDKKFESTSTWAYHSTKTFSYPEGGKTVMTKSSSSTVVLANYELDTEQAFISLGKQKIAKPEQIKIMFSFTGEKDSSLDTPIKSGDYTADAKRFKKVDSVTIYHFADGKEKRTSLSESKLQGKISISGVSGSTVNGSIDVTDGKHTIKGGFSAKGHESVK